ncbi:MAG: hypothetical protein HY726_10700 [Candidatus Rokubacteria bacterium]|nr:hypothetical protein [Candidatus Rokubacteria bacterium]
MTTWRLIWLRLYAITLGRLAGFDRLLRRGLVWWLITRRPPEERYVAASNYFDPKELER